MGKGRLRSNIYDGELKDNKQHGNGKATFGNGEVYEGEMEK
jgi:hypothetical protein